MNEKDINEWMSNGMSIGSHSHYHSDLTNLSENNLINELNFSKKILEIMKNQFAIDFQDSRKLED